METLTELHVLFLGYTQKTHASLSVILKSMDLGVLWSYKVGKTKSFITLNIGTALYVQSSRQLAFGQEVAGSIPAGSATFFCGDWS